VERFDPILVYVAGPYSNGDPVLNTRNAIDAADLLFENGYIPLVPHLSMIWHLASPKNYDAWMSMCFAYLSKCDAVFRLKGESNGTDAEIEHAIASGIPVVGSLEELNEIFS